MFSHLVSLHRFYFVRVPLRSFAFFEVAPKLRSQFWLVPFSLLLSLASPSLAYVSLYPGPFPPGILCMFILCQWDVCALCWWLALAGGRRCSAERPLGQCPCLGRRGPGGGLGRTRYFAGTSLVTVVVVAVVDCTTTTTTTSPI